MDKRLECTALAKEHQKQDFLDFRRRVLDDGEPYVIASAVAPHEIFHAMDIPVVSSEWYSSIIAAKQQSAYYLNFLEEKGYHDGLPRYSSLPMASTLDNDPDRAPYGGLPKPALLVSRTRGDYNQRIYEQWARAYDAPFFPIDSPSSTILGERWWEQARYDWEELFESHRLDFYVDRLEELVSLTEQQTGRKFDHVVFEEQMHRINETGEIIQEARDIIANTRPCPLPITETFPNVMACTWDRGSQWSLDHARAYRDEIKAWAEEGASVCSEEKVRLAWMGNALWSNTGFYRAFEKSHGAVFVWSMYTNFLAKGYVRYFEGDPMRALAARHISMNELLHLPPWMADWVLHEAQEMGAHGVINLVPIGDRLSANGTLLAKKAIEKAGLPVLDISANMVDARAWDNDLMVEKVGNFIEDKIFNH